MNLQLIIFGMISAAGGGFPAEFASFDALPEGFHGQEVVDGGITFFGVDSHLFFEGGTFAVDDIRAAAASIPEWGVSFSSPNILSMTAVTLGPYGGASRFGELMMTTGKVENFASIQVYHFDTLAEAGYEIALEAYLNGQLVANDIAPLSEIKGDARMDEMVIEGVTFDVLRLTAQDTGLESDKRPFFAGGIDNVLIIPEPATLLLLAMGAGILALFRTRT